MLVAQVAYRAARSCQSKPEGASQGALLLAQGPEPHATYLQNLRWAVQRAPGQSLLIEPINPQDMPGYFLNNFDQAAAILDHLNAPNLALQFDAYHAHKITTDMPNVWAKHGHRARHIQIASAEGRHEPGTGALDYPRFESTIFSICYIFSFFL